MADVTPEDRDHLAEFQEWERQLKHYASGSHDDPTPQQVYNRLMKESFGPALRREGMKGSQGRFELPSEKYWAQLGFQKSAFSDSVSLKFTVNLSVIDRAEWAKQAAAEPHLGTRPIPGTAYGSWAEHVRIGRLMPSGEDFWWWLRRGEDTQPLSEHVLATLHEVAVPWLVSKSRA